MSTIHFLFTIMRLNHTLCLPCVLLCVLFLSFTHQSKAQSFQRSQQIQVFEGQLNLYEDRLSTSLGHLYGVAAELKGSENPTVIYQKLTLLRNGINGLRGLALQLRISANNLDSTPLIMGVSSMTIDQGVAFDATLEAFGAYNNGSLSTGNLIPIERNLLEIERTINDCLRREIQIIKRDQRA